MYQQNYPLKKMDNLSIINKFLVSFHISPKTIITNDLLIK